MKEIMEDKNLAIKKVTLKLRPNLFWDVDVNQLDFKKHKLSIIERISLRGQFKEFKMLLAYYGKEQVKQTLLQIRYLDKRTLTFCSTIFDTPITDFRCYKLAQSNQEHWNY